VVIRARGPVAAALLPGTRRSGGIPGHLWSKLRL